MRELDEKRVVVVPVLVEDCKVPTFLREKMYADFRKDFDQGLTIVLESVARITNATQGRVETLNYHTDWSIDWGEINGRDVFRLTMIDHTKEQPYTILAEITIIGDADATMWYRKRLQSGEDETAREDILLALEAKMVGKDDFRFMLSDQMPRQAFTTFDLGGGTFGATMSVRRLGMDTGRNILIRMDGQVNNVANTIRSIRATGDPSPAAPEKVAQKAAKKLPASKKSVKKLRSKKPKRR